MMSMVSMRPRGPIRLLRMMEVEESLGGGAATSLSAGLKLGLSFSLPPPVTHRVPFHLDKAGEGVLEVLDQPGVLLALAGGQTVAGGGGAPQTPVRQSAADLLGAGLPSPHRPDALHAAHVVIWKTLTLLPPLEVAHLVVSTVLAAGAGGVEALGHDLHRHQTEEREDQHSPGPVTQHSLNNTWPDCPSS